MSAAQFLAESFWDSAFLAESAPSATGAAAARLLRPFVSVPSQERSQLACVAALVARPPAFLGVRGWPGAQCEGSGGVWLALAVGAAWWSDDGGADLLGYASGEGRGSVARVRDARRLTRAPSDLATFDLRAETMFWAVENPSPSISKCLDGGFVSYMFVSLLIDSLILGIRARADGENMSLSSTVIIV
jgi:hypothetical protein